MKKSFKGLIAITAGVVSSGAFAASNLENPLYMPQNREVYLKTGAGVMYKKGEKTNATVIKGTDGKTEFPIWRFSADMGYGITDRLDIHGRFGYTHDNDITRKGMHRGRIGLTYRILDETKPLVLDLYTDAYLSGITPMKGTYKRYGTETAFDFDNYSNGRWGAIIGTRFGKTFKNDVTLAAHIEYLATFGNHNNKIAIDPSIVLPIPTGLPSPYPPVVYKSMAQLGFPGEIEVNLRSTHETVAGFDAFYQLSSTWSFGAGFEYIEHYNNGVKSIHTKLNDPESPSLLPAQKAVVEKLLAATENMKDGWDEYVLKVSVANQISDKVQIALFGEYTFDESQPNSQNSTDVKFEIGARLNARF